ncbi:hypothetical protein K488DRAFT_67184 [Vararia minispora EC-137]|uniref:Uncharacterized protein n=1 Tax=Vararia minispora EC-137 TaxID=1314806 RepID=A0ACB8QYT7_9AGAM|nr:hypothetical protein K488DRAFT_67184 [Vararia minispora EC-137]
MATPPSDAISLAMSHPPRQRKQKSSAPSEPALAQVKEADDAVPEPTLDKQKRKSVDWEIPRKALHSSIGFFTLWLYATGGSPQHVVLGLAAALCIILPADVLRLHYAPFERFYESVLGFLMRESEKRKTNGVIWYIVGVIWVLAFYPPDIATVAILLLSWADTAASTFGRLWGRYTPPLPRRLLGLPLAPRKSLAGFLAAAITGTTITAGFWLLLAPAVDPAAASWSFADGVRAQGVDESVVGGAVREWLNSLGFEGIPTGGWTGIAGISVASGVVTALAEALDVGSLDDNLTLPIIAGGGLWACLKALSWLSA